MMFARTSIATDQDVEEDGAGMTLRDIGRAIMIWSSMNYGTDRSVAMCARAFNTTPDVIRDAVEEDDCAFLSPEDEADPEKQTVDVDGS